MQITLDAMKARYAQLQLSAGKITAELDPLRAELDALQTADVSMKEFRQREGKIRPRIKALQEKLFPIEMEMAPLARALGGKGN